MEGQHVMLQLLSARSNPRCNICVMGTVQACTCVQILIKARAQSARCCFHDCSEPHHPLLNNYKPAIHAALCSLNSLADSSGTTRNTYASLKTRCKRAADRRDDVTDAEPGKDADGCTRRICNFARQYQRITQLIGMEYRIAIAYGD